MATVKQAFETKLKNKGISKAEITRRWQQRVLSMGRPGTNVKGNNAPAATYTEKSAFQTIRPGKFKDSILISGQDFIGNVDVPVGGAAGKSLFNILVNPLQGAFAGTRVERFAGLYDKFLFTKLKFHAQASAPTNFSGSYLLAFDRDMADATPQNGDSALKAYYAMAGTRTSAVWEDCTISCPLSDTQQFYYTNYTGYDGRLTAQGQLYVALQVPSNNVSSLSIWVEYELLLMDPSLEALNTYGAMSDTSNIATTSGVKPFIRVSNKVTSGDIKMVPNDQSKDIGPTIGSNSLSAMLTAGWYEVVAGLNGSAPSGSDFLIGLFSDNPYIKVFKDENFNANAVNRTVGDFTRLTIPCNVGTSATQAVVKYIVYIQDAIVQLSPYIWGPASAGTLLKTIFQVSRLSSGKPSTYLTQV